jgi:energy-coupling factor transporter ATP-binding protein EcfA2
VMGLLRELVERDRLTLVIVEHVFNIPRVLDLATTVWTLADGEISIESREDLRSESAIESGVDGWLRELGGDMVSQDLPGGAVLQIVRVPGVEVGDVVLAVRDLVVYRGKRLVVGSMDEDGVVKGLSFELRRGELGVLQAPNGWGKTTLLDAIAGLIPSDSGEVYFDQKLVQDLPSWNRMTGEISYMRSQNNYFPKLKVIEMLRLSRVFDIPIHLKSLQFKLMSSLSGGEKQKIIISCCMTRNKRFFVMDEPFSALDLDSVETFMRMIRLSNKTGYLIALPKAILKIWSVL